MWPLSVRAGKIHLLFEGSAPNGTGFQNSNNRLPGVKIADVLARLGDEGLPRRLRAGNHLYFLLTFLILDLYVTSCYRATRSEPHLV